MTQEKQHGLWFHILDVVFNIVVIVTIVACIRTFLVSPFQVEGNSMVSTLEDKEYIVINKLSYFIGHPSRGEIVVFRPPNEPGKYYVKRVIGEPGDQVVIKGGYVYVRKNNEGELVKIDEPYLDPKNQGKTFRHPAPSGDPTAVTYDVPEGHYFVLGDNRLGSLDSRGFMLTNGKMEPFVPEDDIKGKVWFIALPITKIHAFDVPEYGL